MTNSTIPRSLVEMIEQQARKRPDKAAFIFDDQPYTYSWLWQRANQFAAQLAALGVTAGDRVVMAMPNGPEFFVAFYGTLRLGAVAVPVFPSIDLTRCRTILRLCGSRLLVVPSTLPERQAQLFARQAEENGFSLVPVGSSPTAEGAVPNTEIKPDDVAYIQYTSGSTADPRGVQLTHFNLLTNVRQMIAGMQITASDVFVSWLPVFHDMGLILMTMAPMYLGARLVILPASLRQVTPWLKAIEQYRGTFTAAPDMAYRLCLRSVREPDLYDLSTLRVALNAAEPVRQRTMEDFEAAFGIRNILAAGYGLAEATVGVSMWTPGTPKKVDIDGHVSVGPSFPDVEIQIVEDGKPLQAGSIGEVAVRSPANTVGYYDNPEANKGLRWRDGYILTGDLGYLDDDGHLFIVSRKKNLIIHAGKNLYPADVEEVAEGVSEVRRAAAIGIEPSASAGEQLYLFAELGKHQLPEEELRRIIIDIVNRIYGQFGLRPGRVYLLKPKSLPFTPNGKMQHARLKELYQTGLLRETNCIVLPCY